MLGARPDTEVAWAEILASGLTFDAIGLAPGRTIAAKAPRRWRGEVHADAAGAEAIGLAPGPHLAGAGHLLPVIKAQFGVAAALLAHCPGAVGAMWIPSQVALGASPFVELVRHWLVGGPFPAPALVEIVPGEGGELVTSGLAFFLGKEIRLRAALAADALAARRLIFRLADRFVEGGGAAPASSLAIDAGSWVRVTDVGSELVVDHA